MTNPISLHLDYKYIFKAPPYSLPKLTISDIIGLSLRIIEFQEPTQVIHFFGSRKFEGVEPGAVLSNRLASV